MKKRMLLSSVAALCAVFGAVARGGVIYVMESTAPDLETPTVIEVRAQDGLVKMRFDGAASGSSDGEFVIFDSERKTLTVASPEERAYYVIGEEELNKLSEAMSAMQRQMEQALAQVPESQREQMRQMMGGMMGVAGASEKKAPEIEVQRSDETRTIGDYKTTKYVVRMGERHMSELWVTPWENVEGADELRQSFASMSKFFSMMMEAMPQMAGSDDFRSNWMRALDELDGFPVQSTTARPSARGGDSVTETTTLKSVREAELSERDFQPPEGFKRRSLEMPSF